MRISDWSSDVCSSDLGLDLFDASEGCGPYPYQTCYLDPPTPSRVEADPTAALVRFTGLGEFRPVPNLAFTLLPRAQYTRSAMLSYEELPAGNDTVGRGYDPGELIGDKIGRAPGRERGGERGEIAGVAGRRKKKKK